MPNWPFVALNVCVVRLWLFRRMWMRDLVPCLGRRGPRSLVRLGGPRDVHLGEDQLCFVSPYCSILICALMDTVRVCQLSVSMLCVKELQFSPCLQRLLVYATIQWTRLKLETNYKEGAQNTG